MIVGGPAPPRSLYMATRIAIAHNPGDLRLLGPPGRRRAARHGRRHRRHPRASDTTLRAMRRDHRPWQLA